MEAIASEPVLENSLVHVFSVLPKSREQDCEVCKKVSAVYCWTKRHGSEEMHSANICRVCASMVVLVGKPK